MFFLNTGMYELNSSTYEVLINGAAPTSTTQTVLPSGSEWNPGHLLEVVLTDTSWSFSDGEDVSVYFVGISERVNGFTHSASTNGEVRLNAFA